MINHPSKRPIDIRCYDQLTGSIIAGAIRVHSTLGPGLLESAYRACLSHELRSQGCGVECEVALPIEYRGVEIDVGYRIDMLVEHSVIVELKAVRQLHPVHQAQLLSYLKLSGLKVGLILNFHVPRLRDGIVRMVNDL